jgi:preprotein translocase subunit SecG
VIFLILMHSGKDAGLSGAFGVGTGQGSLGGGSLVERNLNRWTVVLAILWVVDIVLLVKKPW